MARYPGRVVPLCHCECDDLVTCQIHTTSYSIRKCTPCEENKCDKTKPVRHQRNNLSARPSRTYRPVMTAAEVLEAMRNE